jgi:acyl-CoA thioesterase-1
MKKLFLLPVLFIAHWSQAQIADSATYLNDLKSEMQVEWPKNRTINIVFHGHSVPAGYFKTSQVNHPNELGHELIANELMKWFK